MPILDIPLPYALSLHDIALLLELPLIHFYRSHLD
jgi:hypothetical protein